MTLLRAVYRTMLASYFISSGVKAVRNPAPLAPLAQPLAEKVVPAIKQYAPNEVAGFVPEDPTTLVRINGAVQIIGGLALASGRGRRVGALLLAGSLIPSTLAKYPFWEQTGDEKAASRAHFAKNVSLLGGVLLASRDTEGRPGIAWRAQAGGQAIAKSTSRATKKLTHSGATDKLAKQAGVVGDAVSDAAGEVADKTSDLAEAAVAGGAALLSAAAIKTRGTRKKARKQFKRAQKVAVEQAKDARAVAAKQAKIAGERLAEQAKEARKTGAKRAAEAKKAAVKHAAEAKKVAAKNAAEARKSAEAAAKQARKDAKKTAKKSGKELSKRADKVRKNITLGEN